MKIDFSDIKSRLNIKDPYSKNMDNYSEIRIWNESGNIFFEKNAIGKIYNWKGLNSNSLIAFTEALDTFDEILEYSNSLGNIRSLCKYLVNEMKLVRDAKQLQKRIKGKLGYFKRKSSSEVHNKMQKKNKLMNSSRMKLKDSNNKLHKRSNIINECYSRLISQVNELCECDRIISNYNKVNRRYNLDNVMELYNNGQYDLYSVMQEMAYLIDTFDMPFKNRFNSAMEMCWYSCNKNHLKGNKDISIMTEAILDYFLFHSDININEANMICERSLIIDYPEFHSLKYIYENKDKDDISLRDKNEEPKEKISIEIKDDDKEERPHKPPEPYSYTVFEKPKGTQGIPDMDDYGINSDKDQYPLWVKIKENGNYSSTDIISKIVDDFRSRYYMLIKDNIDSYIEQARHEIECVLNILKSVPKEILLDKLPYILSLIRNNFIFIYDEEYKFKPVHVKYILNALYGLIRHISIDNEDKHKEIIEILDKELYYTDQRKLVSNFSNFSLDMYKECLAESIYNIKSYKNMLESISYNNIYTELSNMYLSGQIMSNIVEMTNEEDISTIIENNINIFSENGMLDKLAKCVIHNNAILDVDKFRNRLLEYKDNLKQNDSIKSHRKIDNVNEAIEILNNSKKYRFKDFKSILSNLLSLESIISICTTPEIIRENSIDIDKVKEISDIINNHTSNLKNLLNYIDTDKKTDDCLHYSKILDNDIRNLITLINTDSIQNKELIHLELSKAMFRIAYYCLEYNYASYSILPKMLSLYHDFYSDNHKTPEQLNYAIGVLSNIKASINQRIAQFGSIYSDEYIQRKIIEYKKLINLFDMVIDKLSIIYKQTIPGGEE